MFWFFFLATIFMACSAWLFFNGDGYMGIPFMLVLVFVLMMAGEAW